MDIDAFVAAGAPVVFAIIQIIRQAIDIPSRIVPAVGLVLSGGYVTLASVSGMIEGNYFEHMLIVVGLTLAASGIHSTIATYNDNTVATTAKG